MDGAQRDGRDLTRRQVLKAGGVVASTLMLPAITACGSSGGSSSSGTLEYMFWGSSFEKDAIEAMLDKFTDETGIETKSIHVPGDYAAKLATQTASRRLPDVAYMDQEVARPMFDQGHVIDIAPHISKYPQLSDREPTDYFWMDDGKATIGTGAAYEMSLLFYNRETLREAGVEDPPATADAAWSWDQIVDAAERLTFDAEGRRPAESGFDPHQVRQFGLVAPPGLDWCYYGLLRSNGGDLFDEKGTECVLDSPEAIDTFQKLQDLIHVHRVAPTQAQLGQVAGGEVPTVPTQLQSKRVAMAIDGQWNVLDLANLGIDWGIGVLPKLGDESLTMKGGGPRCIFKGGTLEEALELYVYAMSPDKINLYRDGLWMPVAKKYYEDDAAINSWIQNDNHPPEYRTAALDYANTNSVADFSRTIKNWPKIKPVLEDGLATLETGKRPAKDVLLDLKAQLDSLLQGWYPIPASL